MATLGSIGGPGNSAAIALTQRRESQARTLADTATTGGDAAPAGTSVPPPSGTTATSTFQGDAAEQPSTVAFAQARSDPAPATGDDATAAQTASPAPETSNDADGATTDTDTDAATESQAAQAGPAGGPGGAGGAVRAGGAGGSAPVDNTVYDPLDTNQDGVVSELERLAGELENVDIQATQENDEASNEDTTTRSTLATEATTLYVALSSTTAPSEAGNLLDATA